MENSGNSSSSDWIRMWVLSLGSLSAFVLLMTLLLCVFVKKWMRFLYGVDDAERGGVAAPASNAGALQLSAFSWDKSCSSSIQKAECSICLSTMNHGDMARVLPNCNHFFHMACIDSWILFRATCPLCRCSIISPEPSQPLTLASCHDHDHDHDHHQRQGIQSTTHSSAPPGQVHVSVNPEPTPRQE